MASIPMNDVSATSGNNLRDVDAYVAFRSIRDGILYMGDPDWFKRRFRGCKPRRTKNSNVPEMFLAEEMKLALSFFLRSKRARRTTTDMYSRKAKEQKTVLD